ncbi:hypothetical protein BKA56DRAFT_617464 [Ilyonectria sp. MPI-CAGE-AT-0026]|nr:hypothetical protein BKA56DRAFT_617464 [Ilyonectria sp. MPI-CAGE-AT-0026]
MDNSTRGGHDPVRSDPSEPASLPRGRIVEEPKNCPLPSLHDVIILLRVDNGPLDSRSLRNFTLASFRLFHANRPRFYQGYGYDTFGRAVGTAGFDAGPTDSAGGRCLVLGVTGHVPPIAQIAATRGGQKDGRCGVSPLELEDTSVVRQHQIQPHRVQRIGVPTVLKIVLLCTATLQSWNTSHRYLQPWCQSNYPRSPETTKQDAGGGNGVMSETSADGVGSTHDARTKGKTSPDSGPIDNGRFKIPGKTE